jgi:hypothetical protein
VGLGELPPPPGGRARRRRPAPGGLGPDGTVEAIEGDGDGAGFALGVQWHVEALLTRPEHLAVIEALVGAGRAARDERPRRAA